MCELFRKIDEDFGRSLEYTIVVHLMSRTQQVSPFCNMAIALLSLVLLVLVLSCSSFDAHESMFPKFTTTAGIEHSGGCHFSQKELVQVFLTLQGHRDIDFPLPTISKNPLSTLICALTLVGDASFIISRFCSQNSYFVHLVRYFFSPLSSISDNQILLSSDESPFCAIHL